MTIVQIAPSLVINQSRIFAMNAGAFVRDGDAYLVDPGIFADEIATLGEAVIERGARVRGIIITHSHWDHILGPQHFPGVPVIAHRRAAENLAREADQVERLVAERLFEHGRWLTQRFTIPHIDVVVEDQLVLPFRSSQLHLTHAPGHCDDQLVVYEQLERTLWAADMLSDLEIPFVEDVAAYRSTIERLRQYDIAHLVPGHGGPTSDGSAIRSRIEWDGDYLSLLDREVARAVREGHSLEQTQVALTAWPLRRPDLNAQEHRRNIATAFAAAARGPESA